MKNISKLISEALKEDGAGHDITTLALIPRDDASEAFIIAKTSGVIFGLAIAQMIFKNLDRLARCRFLCKEGQRAKSGQKIFHIKAKTRAILSGERTALNFLTHLSGIATTTAEFVARVRPFRAKVLDTRKTTPGLRALEKQAVKAGGGVNHRADLSSMVLIKDNHRLARRKKMPLVQKILAAKKTGKPVEVEVDNLNEFKIVLGASPDIILFDNMPPAAIKRAVSMTRSWRGKKPLLEASGGVNLKNIRAIAKTGVDRISVGALTHSRKTMDLSLELIQK